MGYLPWYIIISVRSLFAIQALTRINTDPTTQAPFSRLVHHKAQGEMFVQNLTITFHCPRLSETDGVASMESWVRWEPERASKQG